MSHARSHLIASSEHAASHPAARTELLVRLLIRHQDELFRYIFTLLPHHDDARDCLQETCVALYRKFADYDVEKPFLAWAYGFAYLEVLKNRERNSRSCRLLADELLEFIAEERPRHEPELHRRLQALDACLRELPKNDCELIRQRYFAGWPTDQLVEHAGASRRTLFRNLDRVRRLLFECIERRLQST